MDTEATLTRIRAAMREGARLDVVRLLFNPTHPWGVNVWERGTTRGGNEKWVKVVLLIPNDGETVADTLKMLGDMTASPAGGDDT